MSQSCIQRKLKTWIAQGKWCYLLLAFIGNSLKAGAYGLEWAFALGSNDADVVNSIVPDHRGNIYILGYYADTVDFDPGPGIANLYGGNTFIAKYTEDGQYIWAKTIRENFYDGSPARSHHLELDRAGNIYITGNFSRTVDFDLGPGIATISSVNQIVLSIPSMDIYLAKYDTNGNYLWARSIGGTAYDYPGDLAVDPNGNVFVTGSYKGTIDCNRQGTTPAYLTSQFGSLFLAKFDVNGNYLWAENMETVNSYITEITADRVGNLYMTGGYMGTGNDFDPGPNLAILANNGQSDVFIAKYDNDGKYIWSLGIGSIAKEWSDGITLDSIGNIYITGGFQYTVDFDPGSGIANLKCGGIVDLFVAKYDSGGNYLWATHTDESNKLTNLGPSLYFPMPTHASRGGIALDQAGDIYISGVLFDTCDFDPGAGKFMLIPTFIEEGHRSSTFVSKYDPDGRFVWAGLAGYPENLPTPDKFACRSNCGPRDIATTGRGKVYVGGTFQDSIDFDPGPANTLLTTKYDKYGYGNPTADGFMFKLACGENDISSSYIKETICGADRYILNGKEYTSTGVYTQNVHSVGGCDSIITLDLTFFTDLEPIITVNGFTLGVSRSYATYQWIKDGKSIPGATQSTYTVTENGLYRVAVANNQDCTDTSNAYRVSNTTIDGPEAMAGQIKIYPNPAQDIVYIQAPITVDACLTSVEGKRLFTTKDAQEISLKGLANGIYLLYIRDQTGTLLHTEKIMKQP